MFKLRPTGTLSVLHSFAGSDGASPAAGLIFDAAGNLYGTTIFGGANTNCYLGCGTVFKLTPTGTLSVLHSFAGSDGAYPDAGLIVDGRATSTARPLGAAPAPIASAAAARSSS